MQRVAELPLLVAALRVIELQRDAALLQAVGVGPVAQRAEARDEAQGAALVCDLAQSRGQGGRLKRVVGLLGLIVGGVEDLAVGLT